MEDKIKIEKEALLLISRYGLRNLNMDQLAQTMGISKATIYKSYGNKNQLVLSIIENLMDRIERSNQYILQRNTNPVSKLLEIYAPFFKVLIKMKPNFFLELKKLFPSAALFYEIKKHEIIHNVIKPLLTEAKEKGLIENDVDVDFLVSIHVFMFDAIQNSGFSLLNSQSADLVFDYLFIKNLKGFLKPDKYQNLNFKSFTTLIHNESYAIIDVDRL